MVTRPAWLLDTNILSEGVKPAPDAGVMTRLQRHADELSIPAPVWHELRFGWLRMPEGRRKDAIGMYIQRVAGQLPVLPYDEAAARVHAELRDRQERSGRPLPFVDGQIAAIAIANGLTLVTRNRKDFEDLPGVRLADWHDAQ